MILATLALLALSRPPTSPAKLVLIADPAARRAFGAPMPLIPRPKTWQPGAGRVPLAAGCRMDQHASSVLRRALAQRFLGIARMRGVRPELMVDASLPTGGYDLLIGSGHIRVAASGRPGFDDALRRLALMAIVDRGKVTVPCGHMRDWPSVRWRGAHLFVGPTAGDFHQRLWQRVLLPLGFNKVVLECSRTEWQTLPSHRGGINMRRADLARLCDWYRSQGVEPIPLVGSFGHMEWLFANKVYHELALNPAHPYALDPRKPGTKALLRTLWKEVIQVTGAKSVHFGCDEVTMRGWIGDANLMTDLWKRQMSTLGEIAQANHVHGMIWGDMALAHGEAADYMHGSSAGDALARRRAITQGFQIADWHYAAAASPKPFAKSLRVWKGENLPPIATTWFDPRNICGFVQAAVAEGCGTLQTTWAGFDSNEAGMAAEIKQFAAFVVAADYAWSGRSDPPERLGYDPLEIIRDLYFRLPQPLTPEPGISLMWMPTGVQQDVAGIHFRINQPLRDGRSIKAALSKGTLWLDASTEQVVRENAPVAHLLLRFKDGTKRDVILRYGQDVRARADNRPVIRSETQGASCAVPIHLGKPLSSFEVHGQSIRIFAGTWVR